MNEWYELEQYNGGTNASKKTMIIQDLIFHRIMISLLHSEEEIVIKVEVMIEVFNVNCENITSNYYKLQNLFSGKSSVHSNNNKSSPSAYMASNNYGSRNTNSAWVLDTGTTHHLTNDSNNLGSPTPFFGSNGVTIGNGDSNPISHSGQDRLDLSYSTLLPKNVLHTYQVTTNHVFVLNLGEDNDIFVESHSHSFFIKEFFKYQLTKFLQACL